MERLRKNFKKHLPPLKLYLDDLREIVRILSTYGQSQFAITTADHVFSNIDDLVNLKRDCIYKLTITVGEYHDIDVQLGGIVPQVSGDNERNIQSWGVCEQLVEFLNTRSRPFAKWVERPGLSGAVLGAALLATGYAIFGGVHWITPTRVHWIVPTVLWIAVAIQAHPFVNMFTRGNTVIYLKERHELPGFLKRHADKFMESAVNSIISALIGSVIGWFAHAAIYDRSATAQHPSPPASQPTARGR